jgi:hypothetical protein
MVNLNEMKNLNPYAYVVVIKTKGIKGDILTSVRYFRESEREIAKAFCIQWLQLDANCLMIDMAKLLHTFHNGLKALGDLSQTIESLNESCNRLSNIT